MREAGRPLRLADPVFDQTVDIRTAYRAFEHFVNDYVARGDHQASDFASYIGIAPDGRGGDPAALGDFLEALKRAKSEDPLKPLSN
jgi:hypothetical protein